MACFALAYTAFIGRSADLAALQQHLDAGARLITITVTPGIGKTRLATQQALKMTSGACTYLCSLAEARSVVGICHAMAGALEVPLTGGKTVQDMVAHVGRVPGEVVR